MKITAMYWSATGTTAKVATAIARELDAAHETFDFTLPAARAQGKEFGAEDLVVFGVPVYAGRVPNVLLPYLATVRGNGAKAVLVVLFGNRNFDDGLIELRDILQADGFQTIAGAAFAGEHAFSKTLAAGRPDAQDLALARDFAAQVREKLQSGACAAPVAVEGCTPLRPYYTPRDRRGTPINILKVKPRTNLDKCDGCGVCADVCPMGSIDREHPEIVAGICIKCCACEKKCPKGAKYFDDPGYLYHREELELGYARRAAPKLFL